MGQLKGRMEEFKSLDQLDTVLWKYYSIEYSILIKSFRNNEWMAIDWRFCQCFNAYTAQWQLDEVY